MKGLILDRLGKKQDAIAAFQKAVHLDSEFQEAHQNLAEVQAEIDDTQTKSLKLSTAWYVAKWGALSFGLALAVNEILNGVWIIFTTTSSNPVFRSPFLDTLINTLLFAVLVGIGIAVTSLEVYGKARLFGIVGTLASGFAYIITGIMISIYSDFSSHSFDLLSVIIRFVLLGMIISTFWGAVQKDRELTRWLILTGMIGWAFHG